MPPIKVVLYVYILGLPDQRFSKKSVSVMVIVAFFRWGRAHVKLPLITEVYATNTGESCVFFMSSYLILICYLLSTIETRGKPQERTAEFVRVATTFARRRRHPFLGHKMEPLQSQWPGFDFYRYTPGEPMHGELLSILFIV